MTTAEDILAFIEANADSDTARLAYADFLEEDGYSPRAEFIRVQCELEQRNRDNSIESNRLIIREGQLIREHAAEFRSGPQCEKCGGDGLTDPGRRMGQKRSSGEACPYCFGTGDAGGLMRKVENDVSPREGDWLHTVDWLRGFPRVHCRMEECVQEERVRCDHGCHFDNPKRIGWKHRTGCPQCLGQGRVLSDRTVPTDWLLSVVRHHRGVEVWVTDREPFASAVSPGKHLWFAEDGNLVQNISTIHGFLFDAMPGESIPFSRPNRSHKLFDSKELAQVALARAIPAWVRGHG